jgi:hypothetical protein
MPPPRFSKQPTHQPKHPDKSVGISHFPLQEEQRRQREVPPIGTSKEGTTSPTGQVTQGHRRSRAQGRQAALDSDGRFGGKGGKGGKTGGSRAGLLASQKKPGRR